MSLYGKSPSASIEKSPDLQLFGHRAELFTGHRAAILHLPLSRRGPSVPAYDLAAHALRYSAGNKELRDAGYMIESRTKRVGRQVHCEFRLVSCHGEDAKPEAHSGFWLGGAQ